MRANPLHKCAEHGHDDVVAYLLNKEGVDAGALAKDGSSPLILASSNGHLACVDHLLNTDCDLDAATLIREDHGGCTAILLASQNGHASVVKSLLIGAILISLIKKGILHLYLQPRKGMACRRRTARSRH